MVEIKAEKDVEEVEEVEELVIMGKQELGNKLPERINKTNYLHKHSAKGKIRI